MRRKDGTKVGYTRMIPNICQERGHPWWLVHQAHLHAGLVEVARKEGVKLAIDARVTEIACLWEGPVRTEAGKEWAFDLLVGSDGVNSIVSRTILPHVKPRPPMGNCVYRAIVPFAQIEQDPIARELVQKLTMEVWMGEGRYIITYPISAGPDFNLVLSHHREELVEEVQGVDMRELRETYREFDERIRRVLDMIPSAQRWPLLVTGPLERWSSKRGNVVLMGDAAHSMVNHMVQGAATSIEGGAFLGRILAQVIQNRLTLPEAISIYEKICMPKSSFKQQVAFLNGAIWHLSDGPLADARDKAMEPEIRGSIS
ncbi:hypothetical protein MMC30_005459 [Trapelia coarctata]|nr:hypothetical protein [Trapelia coarctata]